MTSPDTNRLDGKTALVTGAARGLGRELAVGLARRGASLVLADVGDTKETAEAVAAAGARFHCCTADVSREDQVQAMAASGLSAFGKIDVLVNNAGVSQLNFTPSEELPVEDWDRVIAINLRGTFLCCKHVGAAMLAAGEGSIINVATTAGIRGIPRAPAYCASKAGVILLTKTLAAEWASRNVRVNAVAPHYLETDLTTGLRASDKVHKALTSRIPLRRFGMTSELLGVVLLLASEASSYMTGSILPVDGGFLAQ